MSDIRLFCSDLDGTLIGNRESTQRFRQAWEAIARAERPCLCYSTGRLIDDTLMVIDTEGLPAPDYVLAGIGTQSWDASRQGPLPGFGERFEHGWDLARIERLLEEQPGVVRQPAGCAGAPHRSGPTRPRAPARAPGRCGAAASCSQTGSGGSCGTTSPAGRRP